MNINIVHSLMNITVLTLITYTNFHDKKSFMYNLHYLILIFEFIKNYSGSGTAGTRKIAKLFSQNTKINKINIKN